MRSEAVWISRRECSLVHAGVGSRPESVRSSFKGHRTRIAIRDLEREGGPSPPSPTATAPGQGRRRCSFKAGDRGRTGNMQPRDIQPGSKPRRLENRILFTGIRFQPRGCRPGRVHGINPTSASATSARKRCSRSVLVHENRPGSRPGRGRSAVIRVRNPRVRSASCPSACG